MFSVIGDKLQNSGIEKSGVDMEHLLKDDDI